MKEKKVNDHELDRDREDTWFCLSKALAIIAVVCGAIALGWILSALDEQTMLRRAEIATPLGMAFAAALTFTTVVWRGLVGEFQAREQKRANDAKDREITARFLLDGATLLGEGKISHISAGIAALETVVTRRRSKLIPTAMNILADYITENINQKEMHLHVDRARRAMARCTAPENYSHRTIVLDGEEHPDGVNIFNGFSRTIYQNVKIKGSRDEVLSSNRSYLINCTLHRVKLRNISDAVLHANKFVSVDFSGVNVCTKRPWIKSYDTNFEDCFYYRDSPPTGDGAHLILPYLEARDRPTT